MSHAELVDAALVRAGQQRDRAEARSRYRAPGRWLCQAVPTFDRLLSGSHDVDALLVVASPLLLKRLIDDGVEPRRHSRLSSRWR